MNNFDSKNLEKEKWKNDRSIKTNKEAYIRGSIYAMILCFVMLTITQLIYTVLQESIYEELDVLQTEELYTMETEIHHAIQSTITSAFHLSQFPNQTCSQGK